MDNLPKDFNPKSCLFSFKCDEQTGKICSAITVEHYDGKGSCDTAWFLDKELSGEYEAYSFSNGDLVSIIFNRNKAIEYGKHSAPGRWLEFKVKSKEEIDWKLLICKEIEKSETIWSQRRSIAENNYAYRLEENDIEDDAETEVMIDVSGSVDLELVKSFLRQLKPLLQQSKLRVGCFNEQFWGMVDIKNVREIDNFTIPRGARGHSAWTEDWDLAVRSFTKKREINKIVFTDGYPCPGTMPKEDLKRENIIWLVYGNKDFKPCCGKVINITEKQLEQLHQIDKSSSMEDISR